MPGGGFSLVNDCSTDSSAELLRKHHYPFLDLPVNLGIGGNVQCGYLYAVRNGYDVAVQMDGDGQHDPAYLMEIVQPVLDGECDMCIGSRFVKKEASRPALCAGSHPVLERADFPAVRA